MLVYQTDVSTTLSTIANLSNSKQGVMVLRKLLDRGESLCVELSELTDLRNVSILITMEPPL